MQKKRGATRGTASARVEVRLSLSSAAEARAVAGAAAGGAVARGREARFQATGKTLAQVRVAADAFLAAAALATRRGKAAGRGRK